MERELDEKGKGTGRAMMTIYDRIYSETRCSLSLILAGLKCSCFTEENSSRQACSLVTLNNEYHVRASNHFWSLVSFLLFFQAVWNKSRIEADWVHIVSHMYLLCWRSIHSHTEMYSCGATACLTHTPTLTHMQMPTGTCTHAHTIRGNLYLIHSISNLRQPERNCFFFLPCPLNTDIPILIQGTGAQNTCRKSFVCFTIIVVLLICWLKSPDRVGKTPHGKLKHFPSLNSRGALAQGFFFLYNRYEDFSLFNINSFTFFMSLLLLLSTP